MIGSEVLGSPVRLAPGEGRADSTLWRLQASGKDFLILRQRGSFPAIAYDHGRLLAGEIDRGVFPEIVSTIRRGIDQENKVLERICAVAYECFNKRMHANVSREFRDATQALADGYLAGGGQSGFDATDVREVIFGIEVANIVVGLLHRLSLPVTRTLTGLALALQCLPYAFDKNVARSIRVLGVAATAPGKLRNSMRQAGKARNRAGYGCTAFAVAAQHTADGKHLHGRNLDGEMYTWNEAPLLSLIDETEGRHGWHKYVACGTAGLIYPGGISGINDAGIAVSLHQMSTTRYHSGFLFSSGEIAPYVEQRVLREASTLDEAVDLVRSLSHFAAWTIFCSEAATGKMARIELNGSRVRVLRGEDAMAQTNHFLHPDMVERAFNVSDGHFTPTFGKWLETRARMGLVEHLLAKAGPAKVVNTDWAIEHLASHEDWALKEGCEGSAESCSWLRSFGRTPAKAYGQLTSIVRGDPDRSKGCDEVWMTVGERRPATHSTMLGWHIDWGDLSVNPVAERPSRRTETAAAARPNWEEALQHYVEACIAATRPRDADGAFLNRDPSREEILRDYRAALAHLDRAIELALADGVEEVPFRYMRARLRHSAEDYAGSLEDWTVLLEIWDAQKACRPPSLAGQPSRIHDFEAALILILSAAAEDMAQGNIRWTGRGERLAEARLLLRKLRAVHFPGRLAVHRDLRDWERRLARIEAKGGGAVELPEDNFITVE